VCVLKKRTKNKEQRQMTDRGVKKFEERKRKKKTLDFSHPLTRYVPSSRERRRRRRREEQEQ
jgi:hypothetical protein